MIFLTVGTQFGFDRLVKAVDQCLESGMIDEEIIAQIGPGRYIPRCMESMVSLDRYAFDAMVRSCDAIVSHAGMGSITMALNLGKPLLVMPRRRKYGEVVNEHQVDSARRFAQLGYVLVAYDDHEVATKILRLKDFVPARRTPNRRGVIDRITRHLSQRSDSKEDSRGLNAGGVIT